MGGKSRCIPSSTRLSTIQRASIMAANSPNFRDPPYYAKAETPFARLLDPRQFLSSSSTPLQPRLLWGPRELVLTRQNLSTSHTRQRGLLPLRFHDAGTLRSLLYMHRARVVKLLLLGLLAVVMWARKKRCYACFVSWG